MAKSPQRIEKLYKVSILSERTDEDEHTEPDPASTIHQVEHNEHHYRGPLDPGGWILDVGQAGVNAH
jgi:hypothetical protein